MLFQKEDVKEDHITSHITQQCVVSSYGFNRDAGMMRSLFASMEMMMMMSGSSSSVDV